VVWSSLIGLAFWLGGDWIALQFTDDKTVAKEVSTYLTIVPLTLMGYGVVTIAAGCFNAIDLAKRSLVFYGLRTAVLYLPLSYIATLLADSTGVYIAIGIANLSAGLVVGYLSLRWLSQQRCEDVPGPKRVMELALAP